MWGRDCAGLSRAEKPSKGDIPTPYASVLRVWTGGHRLGVVVSHCEMVRGGEHVRVAGLSGSGKLSWLGVVDTDSRVTGNRGVSGGASGMFVGA